MKIFEVIKHQPVWEIRDPEKEEIKILADTEQGDKIQFKGLGQVWINDRIAGRLSSSLQFSD